MDDRNSDKKAKETKKCVIKTIVKFNYYKDCLWNIQTICRMSTKILKIKM